VVTLRIGGYDVKSLGGLGQWCKDYVPWPVQGA